jgi:hypothetical protein
VEEVTRPGDATGNSWQISHNRRVVLVLLILVLNLVDLQTIVVEEDGILRVNAVAEVITLKDSLELSEELEGIFNAGNHFEVFIDVALELCLHGGYVHIELNEITIEGVIVEVKKSVILLLESAHIALELIDDAANVLKVVLLEGTELLDSAKELNELRNSAAEEVKLAEDLVGRELELLSFGHVHQTLLGDLVLLLVSLVELEARLEDWYELLRGILVMLPEDIVVDDLFAGSHGALSDSLEVENVVLAVVDHLLSDLHKESSHAVVGVVVSSNGVDHLDAVHQSGKGILDSVRGTFIEGLDDLLEG